MVWTVRVNDTVFFKAESVWCACACTGQGLRLLSVCITDGERLVLTMARLARDVAIFIALQMIVISAFAVGMWSLFADGEVADGECSRVTQPYTASFSTAALHLLQLSTGGVTTDGMMDCFRSSQHSAVAAMVLTAYLLISVGLLFSLLAMVSLSHTVQWSGGWAGVGERLGARVERLVLTVATIVSGVRCTCRKCSLHVS